MLFQNILGQEHIKNHLTQSVDNGRIPHAQLFLGNVRCGTFPMAIAYSQTILCHDKNDAGKKYCLAKFNNFSHPDLPLAFPATTSGKAKSHAVSSHYLE